MRTSHCCFTAARWSVASAAVLSLLTAAVLFTTSCSDDTVSPVPTPPAAASRAAYILNEGQFGDPSGARLSLYDLDRDSVYTDVFEAANGGSHLGSLGDDILVREGRAYIVMSGSHDVKVISTSDHRLLQSATYPGAAPHDLAISDDGTKLFATMLFSDSVLSIDPATLAPRRGIRVGQNPQGLAVAGSRLFVANSGFGSGTTVSVVDIQTEEVLKTISLSDGPTGIATAPDGSVWVTCTGIAYVAVPTSGRVYVIDGSSLEVTDSVLFAGQLFGPITMSADGNAYVIGVTSNSFYGGPVHRISRATRHVTLNHVAGTYYAIGAEPGTGNLYLADAKSFAGNGEVTIAAPSGTTLKAFSVQRGPGRFAFTF